jgi:hypothetical protein
MNSKETDDGLPKMMVIPLSFQKDMFEDTILLGDILVKNDTCNYLVERCLIYNGRSTHNKNNVEHIKLINNIVYNKFTPCNLDTFYIECKSFTSIRDVEELLTKSEYNAIGVRFYSLKKPIVYYFNTKRYNIEYIQTNLLPDCNISPESERDKKEAIRLEYNGLKNMVGSNTSFNTDHDQSYDIDRIFVLKMKPSENYGIYTMEASSKTGSIQVGQSRISTIEISEKIINYFNKNYECIVRCKWNNIFDKFEVTELCPDVNITFNAVDDVLDYIQKSKQYQKPYYVIDD